MKKEELKGAATGDDTGALKADIGFTAKKIGDSGLTFGSKDELDAAIKANKIKKGQTFKGTDGLTYTVN
jgi:hypothetical protein